MYILSVLAILSFSTILPALAYAAPTGGSAKDWQYVNGNSWGWNYSPNNQINKNNVGDLEVKWLFALEGKSSAVPALQSLLIMEGSTTPPIVRNGKVYVTTQYQRTYAIDAKTGKQLWKYDYTIDVENVSKRLPIDFGGIIPGIGLSSHLHGIRYWEKENVLLLSGLACDIYGINADSGKTAFSIENLCKDIPGNIYKYRQGSVSQTNIGTYDKGRQLIAVLPGAMHSFMFGGDFRHTTIGVNIDTKQIQWRIYSYPPQDKPTKDWALQECDIGFFQSTPCNEVKAKAPQNLEWDWARPNEVPDKWGGVTANWGEIIVDEDTGFVYTQTGNQGPYTYVGSTPGPRLYGSTIMAIDVNKGARAWWLLPFPRDPYDYDCNWGGILAEVTGLGKVYMKGCKEGRLYVMDAKTGKPHYVVDVIDDQIKTGQITSAAAKEPYQGGVRYHLNDPLSTYDMREMVSPDNSKYCGRPCPVYPNWGNGIFATDKSYDPVTQMLFHYGAGLQTTILESVPPELGKSVSFTRGGFPTNTTIFARDAATGKIKWTWFFPISQQRSHLVVTPELVFSGFKDNFVRFFDKNTGTMLREMNLGSDMQIGLTTGEDSDGKQKIFALVGLGGTLIGMRSPGTLVAIGLSERAARTTTVTTTATTTSTTTSVSTSTTTTTTTSRTTATTTTTVTTTSATTSTVTTTSATTATSTVVSTQPARTTTITSQITETVGLPSEVTYAAVAVAIIALIAAAVLTMRKKA